jgi:hypothetical protein
MFLGCGWLKGWTWRLDRRFGVRPEAVYRAEIAKLTALGLIEMADKPLRLTSGTAVWRTKSSLRLYSI